LLGRSRGFEWHQSLAREHISDRRLGASFRVRRGALV
jgi:hypothetical protein